MGKAGERKAYTHKEKTVPGRLGSWRKWKTRRQKQAIARRKQGFKFWF